MIVKSFPSSSDYKVVRSSIGQPPNARGNRKVLTLLLKVNNDGDKWISSVRLQKEEEHRLTLGPALSSCFKLLRWRNKEQCIQFAAYMGTLGFQSVAFRHTWPLVSSITAAPQVGERKGWVSKEIGAVGAHSQEQQICFAGMPIQCWAPCWLFPPGEWQWLIPIWILV